MGGWVGGVVPVMVCGVFVVVFVVVVSVVVVVVCVCVRGVRADCPCNSLFSTSLRAK